MIAGILGTVGVIAAALFTMSAPIGGSAMILGWALLVPAAFLLRR